MYKKNEKSLFPVLFLYYMPVAPPLHLDASTCTSTRYLRFMAVKIQMLITRGTDKKKTPFDIPMKGVPSTS